MLASEIIVEHRERENFYYISYRNIPIALVYADGNRHIKVEEDTNCRKYLEKFSNTNLAKYYWQALANKGSLKYRMVNYL